MTFFMFEVEWNQPLRDFIAQDESRVVGYRRVKSNVNVVSSDLEQVTELVKSQFKHHKPAVKLINSYVVHSFIEPIAIRHYKEATADEIIEAAVKF